MFVVALKAARSGIPDAPCLQTVLPLGSDRDRDFRLRPRIRGVRHRGRPWADVHCGERRKREQKVGQVALDVEREDRDAGAKGGDPQGTPPAGRAAPGEGGVTGECGAVPGLTPSAGFGFVPSAFAPVSAGPAFALRLPRPDQRDGANFSTSLSSQRT